MNETISKITDIYARYCNVVPAQEVIPENYFPLPYQKYICFSTHGPYDSNRYDYYKEVIDLIRKNTDIPIVQVGKPNDEIIHGTFTCFTEDDSHLSYIIKNSEIYLGNDSYIFHIARFHEKKTVILFGSSMADCSFKRSDKSFFLEPNYDFVSSYSKSEIPKKINEIYPEKVSETILSALGLEIQYTYETKHIGHAYKDKIIEIIPDHVCPMKPSSSFHFVLRADLDFNLKGIESNLNKFKSHIVTDQPIGNKILAYFKNNIIEVIYTIKCETDINKDFLADLEKNNIKYNLLIASKKIEFKTKLKVLENKGHVCYNDYKEVKKEKGMSLSSRRKIVSLDGIFSSEYHFKNSIGANESPIELSKKDLDNDLFQSSNKYYHLFKVK